MVSVRGGKGRDAGTGNKTNVEVVEIPQGVIRVQDEIIVTTTNVCPFFLLLIILLYALQSRRIASMSSLERTLLGFLNIPAKKK